MPTKQPFTFTTRDGTTLSAAIYEPSQTKRGTIGFFTPGWSADYNDYDPLLLPLAESYRIIAANPRGHGGSKGILHPKKAVDDLEDLFQKHGEEKTAFIGHSLAAFSLQAAQRCNPKAVVLFNPYVNVHYLPLSMRIGVETASLLKRTGLSYLVDLPLSKLPLEKAGLHMDYPLANTAALHQIDITRIARVKQPLLYFIADNDHVLGTHGKDRMKTYRFAIATASKNSENASPLVKGLNHCLNYKGYAPFLKDEPGKDKQRILDRIERFLEKNLD